MFDVFRFVWFAVRTFLGAILLTLCAYVALWALAKVHSALAGNADPDAALRLVNAYNSQRIKQDRKPSAVTATGAKGCGSARRISFQPVRTGWKPFLRDASLSGAPEIRQWKRKTWKAA